MGMEKPPLEKYQRVQTSSTMVGDRRIYHYGNSAAVNFINCCSACIFGNGVLGSRRLSR